ncbi:two-component system sensor histidine kinase MtrB [Saccharopolyspora erythraea NRRL 2338]|nr:HAMP domain-containing sensor histidine kinase [Saccharopolyspora erythraea]PFG93420.1 two-component system sensor histidine kinase MtrB [Saccharopolyspora erythraea NRRL 2338]
MRRPRLGLRMRIVVALMVVTTTATVAMAFAAYRLQATGTTDRFNAAASAGFLSDLSQAQARYRTAAEPKDRIKTVADYMIGRKGLHWSVVDFMPSANGPAPGPVWLLEGPDYYYGPQLRPEHVDASSLRFEGFPEPAFVATTTPWVNRTAGLVARARTGGTTTETVPVEGGGQLLAFASRVGPDLVLVEFYDMQPLHSELSQLRNALAVVALGVSALGVVLALLAAASVQRPVRKVAAAAHRIGEGAFDTRLPVRGKDEIAELTSAFNTMAQRLGDSIEELRVKDRQQQRFVADVAHDLRTPTASLVAAADSLEHPDPESRSRAVALVSTQARRLARLVDDLLEISRFDSGAAELRPEGVDLRELVREAIELVTCDADVRLDATADTTLVGDPRRLHTIVCNLLANAVHHGAEPVTVAIDGTDPGQVVLRVADSGPGVPEELTRILFDRFVRGDRARSATDGSGLGMAIAQQNALVHGGRITVHNDGGAVFTLTLPRGDRSATGSDAPGPSTA